MNKRPEWIRGKVSWSDRFKKVKDLITLKKLRTVCLEARCPNKGSCWDDKHVTFMILGEECTRACRFCDVTKGEGSSLDPTEAVRIADTVKELGKRYVVVTSVTRDDIEDGGAMEYVKTVKEIEMAAPDTVVELLIPDFLGKKEVLQKIISSGAEVIGHNIEMPRSLYPKIRPSSDYDVSLGVIKMLKELRPGGSGVLIKSSMILGLGEEEKDIDETMKDLLDAGVDIFYMGQYLNPTEQHWPVRRFYSPEEFECLKDKALGMGFKAVMAGPMVRSSYNAYTAYSEAKATLKGHA